ncbi:unnamed protein product, partial [Amoebophrya sp. A25]|eukprot:GSA25T00010651001.1
MDTKRCIHFQYFFHIKLVEQHDIHINKASSYRRRRVLPVAALTAQRTLGAEMKVDHILLRLPVAFISLREVVCSWAAGSGMFHGTNEDGDGQREAQAVRKSEEDEALDSDIGKMLLLRQ